MRQAGVESAPVCIWDAAREGFTLRSAKASDCPSCFGVDSLLRLDLVTEHAPKLRVWNRVDGVLTARADAEAVARKAAEARVAELEALLKNRG